MAQDDQTQKCSSSGGVIGVGSIGRSSSKKPKQKKTPQRGLGVAQLEKIRLEEQQKKDAAVVAAAAILSSPSSLSPTKSSYISLPTPHFHHSHQSSSSSIQFSSLPSVDNSLFRSPLPAQNIDIRKPNNLLINQAANIDGFEFPGHAILPKLWNPREHSLENEISSRLDPQLAHRSTLNLPYESNTVWPLTAPVHRSQQHYQPLSMVNVPLSTSSSSSSSSVLSNQMEPPSNQSYSGNFTPMWSEEEKIVGMKRPYPFSLDNPPGPSFNFKFPAFASPMREDEPASCRSGGSFNFEPWIPKLREGTSCSTSILESYSKNSIKENGASNADFLTLSLPTWASPSPKFKLPSGHLSFPNCEISSFDTLPLQGSVNDPKTKFQPGPSVPTEQQHFYSFFPQSKPQNGQAETTMHNCNGEVRENVDLNLKL